ncbi:mucin-associated surface protein (MASP), putative, partial [Trypanosoma cruzi marinkellei]
MMTGRVLLVCALCVLWCGAGCLYARDLDSKALGDCMPSGALGVNASHVPNGCNKYMPTPPLRSALPISAIQAEDATVVSQEGGSLTSGTTQDTASGPGSGGGSGGKGDLAVPGASTGVVPGVPGSVSGAGAPADSAGSAGAASAPSTPEKGQTGCGDDALDCGGQQSSGSPALEQQDLEVPKTEEPPATQHTNQKGNEVKSTEASTPELENTNAQHEIITPVNENGSTSTDASTAVAANSTSASSQEEATESSSNGSHSSPQGEVITGT